MRPGASDQFVGGVIERASSAVRPVRRHRINRIGHGEYPGTQANLIALDAERVTAAVVAFVMLRHYLTCAFEKIYPLQYLRAVLNMTTHVRPFLFGKLAALEQYAVGNADLPDVVKQRAVF